MTNPPLLSRVMMTSPQHTALRARRHSLIKNGRYCWFFANSFTIFAFCKEPSIDTKMKKFLISLALVAMTVGLNSCLKDYRYPFYGTWRLVSFVEGDVEYAIDPIEFEEFSFFEDGTGVLYDRYGREKFYWDEISNGCLRLKYLSSGLVEDLYYDYSRSTLFLSGDYNFYAYRVYEPIP